MSFRIAGLFIAIAVLTGCSSHNHDNFWFLEKDHNYNRVKEIFREYVDYFPERESANCINETWSLDPSNEYNLKIAFSFSNDIFNKIKDTLKAESIAEYLPNEDCLLILNRFTTNSNYGYINENEIDLNLIDLQCYENKYPIPNFSNFSKYQTEKTDCKLKTDFTIYVLESRTGIFLDDKNLPESKFMPEKWEHGYSKGVAISEEREIIIYWIIIW